MTSKSFEILLTTQCHPAPSERQILLPQGATAPGKSYVLVMSADQKLILKAEHRGDAGQGACVTGAVLENLGGAEARVRYRGIGTPERVVRDRGLLLQCVVALLTVAGAVFAAITAFFKSTSATATGWEGDTAVVVLVIAACGAVAKLVMELRAL